jgi:hypothetical protein
MRCFLQVADFNLSKLAEECSVASALSTNTVTNPRWLAPEVLTGSPHTFASVSTAACCSCWPLVLAGTAAGPE